MTPERRENALARLVLAAVAVALGAGTFVLAGGLAIGWRFALAVLVAAPVLLLLDLLRAGASRGPSPPRPPRSPRAD